MARRRVKKDINIYDTYRIYRKNTKPMRGLDGKKTRGSYDVKVKTYLAIIKDFHREVMRMIIEETFTWNMPFRMGTIRVRKKKQTYGFDQNGNLYTNSIPIDYKATKEMWKTNERARLEHKKIYITNEHSNGYKVTFHWSKKKAMCHGIREWQFIPTRTNKRQLAKCFKENPNMDYYA